MGGFRGSALEPGPTDAERAGREVSWLRRHHRVVTFGGVAAVLALVVTMISTVVAGVPDPPVIGAAPSSPEMVASEEPAEQLEASGGWDVLPAGPVDGRTFPAVAWTGDVLLVWGGEEVQDRGTATGALFDPASGTWTEMALGPLAAKTEHVAVWTGDEAIVCCGRGAGTAAYHPSANRWRELAPGPGMAFPVAVWTGKQMIVTGGVRRGGASVSTETHIYDPSADVWTQGASVPVILERAASAVWTGEQMIVWASYGNDGTGWAYDPAEDAWTALPAPPDEFMSPSLAWSGTTLFVVGAGRDVNEQLVAAAYEPATQRWRTLDPGLPAPSAAEGNTASQAAVWTGEELYVWSGYLGTGLSDEGSVVLSYDPATDLWQHHPPAPVLGWRPDIAWTDHGLLVIDPQAYLRYVPDHRATPPQRLDPTTVEVLAASPTSDTTLKGSVVTSQDLLSTVWRRFDAQADPPTLPDGAAALLAAAPGCHTADDVTGVEIREGLGVILVEKTPADDPPGCDGRPDAIRTVFAVAIPGGIADLLTGADTVLQPATATADRPNTETREPRLVEPVDGWRALPDAPLSARTGHSMVWTGREVVIWGGVDNSGGRDPFANDGAAYDPGARTWRTLAPASLNPRHDHVAVWTGQHMIVWGGETSLEGRDREGAIYDPTADRWRPMRPFQPLRPAVAVWTGVQLLVIGRPQGAHESPASVTALYDPTADTWQQGAPTGHTHLGEAAAVWTGEELLLWGGFGWDPTTESTEAVATGMAYSPATDRWRDLPPAPLTPRRGHSAVWTNEELIVWGGAAAGSSRDVVADGAAYNPATDTWRPLPAAPISARYEHNGVWDGSQMIVWGGHVGLSGSTWRQFADGAAYDPASNDWRPISPAAVTGTAPTTPAVWAGDQLLYWGTGDDFATLHGAELAD